MEYFFVIFYVDAFTYVPLPGRVYDSHHGTPNDGAHSADTQTFLRLKTLI